MTAQSTGEQGSTPPPECPAHRTPLYDKQFAEDPKGTYERFRQFGPTAQVELAPGVPATLVHGYAAALEVLRDPVNFPKNPRTWQATMPADCPVLPMMGYRPNCLFTDGQEHERLRKAMSAALDRVDMRTLRRYINETADKLIDAFVASGEADLIRQYARVLPLRLITRICGAPDDIADRIVTGMSGIFDAVEDEAEEHNLRLGMAVTELVTLKQEKPGPDVVSWMLADSAKLTDDEVLHQIILLCGGGTDPLTNLIANAVRLLLTDNRFGGDLSGGSLPIEEALDEVLWTDPPLANYGAVYPTREVQVGGSPVPPNLPLVISFAGANTDPAVATQDRVGNRAHIAFSAGPHTCPIPAQRMARMAGIAAIERLLDRLPEVRLAIPDDHLVWRPGPFHRALVALPVIFPPQAAPESNSEVPWHRSSSAPTSSTPQDPTSREKQPSSARVAPSPWWNYPVKWLRGR